jgi:hypothetical protein
MSLTDVTVGGWNVRGGANNAAVFEENNIWFVDGDYGSADNVGSEPSEAVALPTTAVDKASRRGIIYVRPRDTTGSVQTYYQDTITIPLTKPHLSILGCAPDYSMPYLGPAIKTSAAGVGSPVLTIKGSAFYTEGMEWTGTTQTADTASIIATVGDGTLGRASGFTIRNCTLRNAKGHLISGGGAIYLDTAIYMKIQNCLFRDNPNSIAIRSVYAAINSCIIDNCIFSGAVGVRDVDIFCNADSGSGMIINSCIFDAGLPAHGVVNKFISFATGVYGTVSNCAFSYAGGNGEALLAATGTIGNIPTTMMSVNNYFESTTEGQGIVNR